MKHVYIAIDQSPVECNGEAVILGVFRKRKRAMAACEAQFGTWPIAARRKAHWSPWLKGAKTDALTEIYVKRDGTDHYSGLLVEKVAVL